MTLLFGSDAVSAGEAIRVAVTDPAGKYVGSSVEVTLDGNCLGSVELSLTEKGHFRLGALSGPAAVLSVYDSTGKCVQAGEAQGGMSSGAMDAGNYSMVLFQKGSLLRGVPSLDYLGRLGLAEGRDYLCRQFTISDGQITAIGDCVVPALNEGALSYTIAEGTSVTTSKSGGAAVGELILIRASYQLDESKGVTADTLRIALPAGVDCFGELSATLNGIFVPYTYDSSNREISISVAGKNQATVYLYCVATGAGVHNISASLAFGGGAVQPIGTAVVRVETAKLNVIERTGVAEGLAASGKTLPNSNVILYDNDEEVGRTTSNVVGSWSMTFNLVQPVYSYSYHFVRAVTENRNLSAPISTEESMITYQKDSAGQLTKITMYNTGDHGPQTTVFDFAGTASTVKPYYRMWPGRYPTFTFKVEFSGDASKLADVYVVTTNSAGDKTYVATTYDAAKNAWVGTHDYTSFNDAPVAVGAVCAGSEDTKIPYDEEKETDFINAYMGAADEMSKLFAPILESMFEFSDEVCSENSYAANVKCFDPETSALVATGTMQVKLDSFEEEITTQKLAQDGYTQDDTYHQQWYRVEIAETYVHLSRVDLSERILYTMLVDLVPVGIQRQGAADNVYTFLYTLTSLGKVVGLGLAMAGGVLTILGGSGAIVVGWGVTIISGSFLIEDAVFGIEKLHAKYWAKEALGNHTRLQELWGSVGVGYGNDQDFFNDNSIPREIRDNLASKRDALQDKVYKYHDDYGRKHVSEFSDLLDEKMTNQAVTEAIFDYLLQKLPEELSSKLSGLMDVIKAGNLQNDFEKLTKDELLDAKNRMRSDFNEHVAEIWDYRREVDAAKKTYGYDSFAKSPVPFMTPGLSMMYVQPIMDPSGYVYEAVPSNRIEGVRAVISCKAENGADWNAADYDQINPQTTGADGGYYWDVPQGEWKVSFTKDGYAPANTEEVAKAAGYTNGWLPVPPPQLEINVGMVSTAAPTVKKTVAYTDRVEVEFGQYMDIASVTSAISLTKSRTALSGCTVEPLNAEYNLEGTTQYATRFSIVPSEGELSGSLTVSVDAAAKNYAGTEMAETYVSPAMVISLRPTDLIAPEQISVALQEETSFSVTLQPAIENKKLSIENLSPDLLTIGVSEVTTDQDGSAEIKLTGILPGSGSIRISEPESGLSKTVAVQVEEVEETHTHSWSSSWSNDADGHWHDCAAANCPITANAQKDSYAAHTSDGGVVTTPATATTAGVKTYSCTVCHYIIKTETIPATGGGGSEETNTNTHTHSWSSSWSNDAAGHWHDCAAANCPITANAQKDAYAAHTSDGGVVTIPATATTAGVKTYSCTVCHYIIKTEAIPATGGGGSEETNTNTHTHSWLASWSNDAAGHWHDCAAANCPITANAQKDSYAVHTSDGGVVTTPATQATEGVKTYSCTVCHYGIKTETIPKTVGGSSESKPEPIPATGDGSSGGKTKTSQATGGDGTPDLVPTTENGMAAAILLAASTAMLLLSYLQYRKRKSDSDRQD